MLGVYRHIFVYDLSAATIIIVARGRYELVVVCAGNGMYSCIVPRVAVDQC